VFYATVSTDYDKVNDGHPSFAELDFPPSGRKQWARRLPVARPPRLTAAVLANKLLDGKRRRGKGDGQGSLVAGGRFRYGFCRK
jgi:hypothetical protein